MFIFVALLATITLTAAVPSSRIVNGEESERNIWNFKASLNYGESHICGASLLTDSVALTAAHCVDGGSLSSYEVVLGEHRLSTSSGKEQRLRVREIRKHEDYDSSTIVHDIALIFLLDKANLNDAAAGTINLITSEEDYDATNCKIIGWGKTSGSSSGVSNTLQQADVRTLTHSVCRQKLGWVGRRYLNGNAHICILGTDETKVGSACNGDSGGPLVCNRDGEWVQAGITSWGLSGCPEGEPSVYTRLSTYLPWIASHM